jgi:Tfp pilus assembly protein PilF
MRHLTLLLATVCLSAGAAAQDPLKVAPEAYKQEFENEYVRVQRVHYAPRVKLPEHDHTALATAYVYLNDAGPVVFKHVGLSYGAVTRPAVKAGSFRLYKAVKETHAVESLSDAPSDFLRVEFKTAPATDPNTLRGKFFRVEAPPGENFRQVQFENEQVRITRLVCAAGKPCDFAAAAEPGLFVALTDAQFKPARGKPLKLAPGQTHWLAAGGAAQWLNAGKAAAELLRFDFKTAPMKNAGPEKPHAHPHSSTATLPENGVSAAESARRAEASELLRRGVALDSAAKLAESVAAHERALALNPELVQAHINLISLYARAGRAEKAESHYRAALAINPDLPEGHYNYGVLLVTQERFAEAAEAFQTCLRLDPYHAEAHHNYAALIERDGRLDEAAAHYRKAIENKPGYRAAHFHLGRILVNQNKPAEAAAEFRHTLTPEDEETPRFMYALGATLIRAGERGAGLRYLREALKRAAALRQTELVASLERDLKTLEQNK